MAEKSLTLTRENHKAVENEFNAVYSKLNVLARLFDTDGASDESSMTLDWSERSGVALMLREMTDNLDELWAAMNNPASRSHPVLELQASRNAA